MLGSIYVHTNRQNGKVYVGQTTQDPEKRWRLQKDIRHSGCRYLNSALHKYGWDGFDHQIVVTADSQDELDNLERVWIILLRATDRNFGYNLRAGGSTGKFTQEARNRMKGRKMSADSRRRMSEAKKGKIPWNKGVQGKQVAWNKGIKSPAISAGMKGRPSHNPWTEESKKKLRESTKGKSNGGSFKLGQEPPNKGTHFIHSGSMVKGDPRILLTKTPEAIQKQSESLQRNWERRRANHN